MRPAEPADVLAQRLLGQAWLATAVEAERAQQAIGLAVPRPHSQCILVRRRGFAPRSALVLLQRQLHSCAVVGRSEAQRVGEGAYGLVQQWSVSAIVPVHEPLASSPMRLCTGWLH